MRRILFLLILLSLSYETSSTFSATAAVAVTSGGGASRCDRQCGSTSVRYPLGFSGDCPILLSCNSSASTAALLLSNNSTAAASTAASSSTTTSSYPIVSFNATASTFLVSMPTACTRTVRDAGAALNTNNGGSSGSGGGGYGVTNRTGIFLGGGCSSSGHTNCSVRAEIMTTLLRTAGCGNESDWTCVVELPSPATNTSNTSSSSSTSTTEGQSSASAFLPWKKVEGAGCEDALTSAVYTYSPEGVFSVEFGVAELGWWLDGTCAANGTDQCAQNATCTDVETPSGEWGHRCECRDGMAGDGYAAGEGCRYHAEDSKKIYVIVAVVLAIVAAGVGAFLLWRRRKSGRRSASERQAAARMLSAAAASSGVAVYSYAEIARATDSFSPTHRLGTGAYGTVYVGKLSTSSSSSSLVAIKRLRCRQHHDEGDAAEEAAQLLNEIRLISSVSHPSLVALLGCCLDRGEQVLVYEFVPNGTLSHHLLGVGGGRRNRRLTWRARLGVAAETAAAIAYLHGMRPPIYHRDVKSSNILLDASLRPKLADFGLSRAVDGRLESHVSTAPQGTPGYVDPEYAQSFHLSDKSDVYSFGVVLLELITAMKVVDFDRPAAEVNLASLALDRIGKGRVAEIVDPAILGGGEEEEWVMGSVRHVSELAFRCLAFQKDVRPAMSEVAAELDRIRRAAPVNGDGDYEEPVSGSGRLRHVSMMDVQIDVSLDDDGTDGVVKKKKKAEGASPVSVQEVWVSDRSSPSTNDSLPRSGA